jgi:antitoxin component of RelBE/YafQ-DinJ toxin-antitoxin module
MEYWTIKSKKIYEDQLNVRIPSHIKKELKKLAKEKGITPSDLARIYIQYGLEAEKQKVVKEEALEI